MIPAPGEVVACALGKLYLRAAVVEWLTRTGQFDPANCDAAALEAAFGHITRLRDVFNVALTPNPRRAHPKLEAAVGTEPSLTGAWLCPIDSTVDTNGQHVFAALRPCGHVIRHAVALEIARGSRTTDAAVNGKRRLISDGISSIEGGAWECPCCSGAVEVPTCRLR